MSKNVNILSYCRQRNITPLLLPITKFCKELMTNMYHSLVFLPFLCEQFSILEKWMPGCLGINDLITKHTIQGNRAWSDSLLTCCILYKICYILWKTDMSIFKKWTVTDLFTFVILMQSNYLWVVEARNNQMINSKYPKHSKGLRKDLVRAE